MLFLDLSFWESAFRGVFALLCKAIYPIISILYKLFINITQVRILQSEKIEPIYQRITMILTIVMVFYITFQFVKYVVQPDNMTDKEKGAGNIVYRMVIVIVLIAFVPNIFNAAYDIQHVIVKENVISKVIIGPQVTDGTDMGTNFSATVFSMFYGVDEENENIDCQKNLSCKSVVDLNISSLKTSNSLSSITTGLNATEDKESEFPLIRFDGLLAVVVGGLILYILILYSIDVGARWAQLVYLQIISPIAILGYLSPKKDGTFQKWTKQCITTYLDLFLRIAIINIALLICDTLLLSFTNDGTGQGTNLLAELGEISYEMEKLIYIVLIMGVLMFAHKAPKMLAELFPKGGVASGNFGLSAKDRGIKGATRVFGAAAGTVVGGAAGALSGAFQGARRRKSIGKDGKPKGIGAGVWGATKGAVSGLAGGAVRGLANGSKKGNVVKNSIAGAQKQMQVNQRFGNREENGYGFMDQMEDRARGFVKARSRVDMLEADKAPIKRHTDALKKVEDTRSKIEKRAIDKITESGKGGAAAQKYLGAQRRLKELQENEEVREKEFKVARFTDDKKAQAAYNADVELAKASINKANYVDPTTGVFNKEAYDKAVDSAVSKVNASDYSVAYKTDAEAQAAYQAAVKAKTDGIDKNLYATEEEYNKALKDAAATVNAEIYTKGYATEKDAQEALGQEIQKQLGIVDKAKDAAVAEYVAILDDEGKPKDGAIVQMLEELQTDINEYNKTATTEEITQVPIKDANGNITGYESVTRRINLASSEDIIKHFDKFTDEVKGGKINAAKNKNATKIIELDSEIDRIKRQTSGSGINEGKK